MKTIKDYLQEQLYQDLCYKCSQVDEAGGLYDGQIELASYIMNDLEKNKDKKSFKMKYEAKDLDFENIYFNEMTIYVKFWNRTTVKAYSDIFVSPEEKDVFKRYNYDNDSKRLDKILIEINCPNDFIKYYDDIRGRISHELNHCYTYYELVKDDFEEPEKVPEEYHNRLHEWKDKIYSKIADNIEHPSFDEAEQISYNLIYTLTRYERNAFLAEILSYLFDKNSSFSKAEEIQSKLNSSHQYNLYVDEGPEIIDIIKNKWTEENKDALVKAYNNVYGNSKNSKTFKKIIKLLETKLEETIKKINKNVDKLCKRYINRTTIPEGKTIFYDPPFDEISFLHNPYNIELF